MSTIGGTPQTNTYPSQGYGSGENEDLKQLRIKEARASIMDGIEAFKITEKKKNIEAIR
ncbi:type III secretion effector protein [Pseudomonas yamanorum]|uniref:type III secretion effector protein n=1 Tax=Pseudomonas yamanorum TaxID=515393 RepID=UPI003F74CDDF